MSFGHRLRTASKTAASTLVTPRRTSRPGAGRPANVLGYASDGRQITGEASPVMHAKLRRSPLRGVVSKYKGDFPPVKKKKKSSTKLASVNRLPAIREGDDAATKANDTPCSHAQDNPENASVTAFNENISDHQVTTTQTITEEVDHAVTKNMVHPNDSTEDDKERESDAVDDRERSDRQLGATSRGNKATVPDLTGRNDGNVDNDGIGTFTHGS